MDFGEVPIRRLRCPRCKAPPSSLTEVGTVTMSFAVTEDGERREAEGYQEAGDVLRLLATCRACRHRWRVRGAVQVTCVDVGPERA